jgi:hypothetical protein
MPTTSRSLGAVVLGAALAASLAACGSSSSSSFADKSPASIKAAVEKDMATLTSLRLSGSLKDNGDNITFDLASDTDGNCAGTFGTGDGQAQVLSVGGVSYMKADDAFWRAQAGAGADQVIALLQGKWAKLPADSGGNPFAEFCDLDNFIGQLFKKDDSSEKVTKGKVTKVAGKDALEIVVVDSDGTNHVFVATEGKHYVLKAEKSGSSQDGTLTLSDFDKKVDAQQPADTEVVDMSTLQ